jgi:hypothetical protein
MDAAKVIAAVPCPACLVPAGEPCTRPTDTTRLPVAWVHSAREDAYERSLAVDQQNYFLTFGIRYYSEPHPTWPECNPKGWVRITASDYEEARVIAELTFGLHWSMLTPAANFNPRYFPAGELMVLP